MNITWLGQSGFLLENSGQRLVIDPYFSDIVERKEGLRRLMPAPCSIADLSADALVITHDHLDHFDPETVTAIMATFPSCRLIGPASVADRGGKAGLPESRLSQLASGKTIQLGDVAITATPARHSDKWAVGLLLHAGGELLWFSGDTLYYPELAHQVRQIASRPLDIAFVCINGRLGNMSLSEAAQLMAELQPRLAIPMHYGMFAENTADPDEFVAACVRHGRPAVALECGRAVNSARLLSAIPSQSSRT